MQLRRSDQEIADSLHGELMELNKNWPSRELSDTVEYEQEVNAAIKYLADENHIALAMVRYIFHRIYGLWPEQFITKISGVPLSERFGSAVQRFNNRISPRDYLPPRNFFGGREWIGFDPNTREPFEEPQRKQSFKTERELAWDKFLAMVKSCRD